MKIHPLAERLRPLLRSRWTNPEEFLNELESDDRFAAAFGANVGVQAVFTLRAHTLAVMRCYEVHFAGNPRLDPAERGWFRLFLALHDIGKPQAIEAGDKRLQHRFTTDFLRRTRELYPVTDADFDEWIALVDGDPVGAYLKREIPLREAVIQIRGMAGRSRLMPGEFYRRLIEYYQCDVSAYTRRSGIISALDGLFVWEKDRDEIRKDERGKILKFSERIGREMDELEEAVMKIGGSGNEPAF